MITTIIVVLRSTLKLYCSLLSLCVGLARELTRSGPGGGRRTTEGRKTTGRCRERRRGREQHAATRRPPLPVGTFPCCRCPCVCIVGRRRKQPATGHGRNSHSGPTYPSPPTCHLCRPPVDTGCTAVAGLLCGVPATGIVAAGPRTRAAGTDGKGKAKQEDGL